MSDRLRAIDALIAERLMGVPSTGFGLEFWRVYKQDAATGEWRPRAFSTDPAASKQARDKMRELGWIYTITLSGAGIISASFIRHFASGMESGNGSDESETVAVGLAIVAALATPWAMK